MRDGVVHTRQERTSWLVMRDEQLMAWFPNRADALECAAQLVRDPDLFKDRGDRWLPKGW